LDKEVDDRDSVQQQDLRSFTLKMRSKIGHLAEELPTTKGGFHFVRDSEIISSLKPLLNVSRLFGVPSFSLVETLVSRGGPCSILGALNIFFLLNQILLFVGEAMGGRDLVKKSGPPLIMRLHVICVHFWAVFYSRRLAKGLRGLPGVEQRLSKVYQGNYYELINNLME
jgi:hypothetical protein